MAEGEENDNNLAGVAPPVARVRKTTRVPTGSAAFSRLLPILIIALALVMAVLILVAAGVLLGIVPYR